MKARIIQRILYIILIIACIGLYIFEVVVNKAEPTANLSRFVIIVICCIIGLLRSGNPQKVSIRKKLSIYEESFAKEIGNAFSHEEKNRKKLLRAIRYYDEDKLKQAANLLIDLKKDCRSSDDYYAVELFLALTFTEMQYYEEAIYEYQQIIERRLETGTVYNNLGHVYARIGKAKDAMFCYEKALVLNPNSEYAHINVANAYFYEKDFDTAISYAQKALDINSKLRQASSLLAIIYALQEDKENADKYFHLAISNGQNPKDLKDAIAYYKGEINENPS